MSTIIKKQRRELSRSEKIILFLYDAGDDGRKRVRFEDIVVGLFKKYPHDFHLKGYSEYPDSGDLIHKPLYDSKKKGYVNALNKVFSLTDGGVEYAKSLLKIPYDIDFSENRLSRNAEVEISRIRKSEGFGLFSRGEKNKISDNDLYDYLGVTVRTQKNAFIGRMKTINKVMEELQEHEKNNLYTDIVTYHEFLISKYQSIINFFTSN